MNLKLENNSTLTNSHTKQTTASSPKHLTYCYRIPCPQTVHTYLIQLFIMLNMGPDTDYSIFVRIDIESDADPQEVAIYC